MASRKGRKQSHVRWRIASDNQARHQKRVMRSIERISKKPVNQWPPGSEPDVFQLGADIHDWLIKAQITGAKTFLVAIPDGLPGHLLARYTGHLQRCVAGAWEVTPVADGDRLVAWQVNRA